jgi:hypothetical protein
MGGGVVQDNMVTSHGRRATATCASLLAAGLFIDLQTLVGDGALFEFGFWIGGGSASIPVSVSAELELGGGRWLRWLQKTLGTVLYFSIF